MKQEDKPVQLLILRLKKRKPRKKNGLAKFTQLVLQLESRALLSQLLVPCITPIVSTSLPQYPRFPWPVYLPILIPDACSDVYLLLR